MKLTDYLAIYAAGLSTLVFLWNLSRSRSKIRVKLLFGANGDDEGVQSGVWVSIQNISPHTMHLSNLSVLFPYRIARFRDKFSDLIRYRRLPHNVGWVQTSLGNYDTEDGFPVSLEARKSLNVFIPDAVLSKMLDDAVCREIRAKVQDALWRDTYSARLKINWNTEHRVRKVGVDDA